MKEITNFTKYYSSSLCVPCLLVLVLVCELTNFYSTTAMPGLLQRDDGWDDEPWTPGPPPTEEELIRDEIDYHQRMILADQLHIDNVMEQIVQAQEKVAELQARLAALQQQQQQHEQQQQQQQQQQPPQQE